MKCNHALLHIGSKISEKFGLHLAEMNAIDMLGRHGPMTMGNLSKVTFVSPSNTTHTVKKLEAAGLVKRKRSEDSDREVSVFLTRKGVSLYTRTCPAMIGEFESYLQERLSDKERKILAGLLQQLSA